MPVYPYSLEYATRHDERDLWRESYQLNCDCARAIERSIDENFNGTKLSKDCAKSVLDEYGMPDMKGITVRIDAALHAEIKAYLEQHEMTMGEFIALAAQDELHPKTPEVEVKEVGKMRTLAFQVEEELFQRVKQYLERNNMTQRQFVIGLIEEELDRDEELLRKQQEGVEQSEEEEQGEGLSEDSEVPVSEDSPGDEYEDEQEDGPTVDDSEGGFDEPDEEESEQDFADDEPEYSEDEGAGQSEEEEQAEGLSEGSEAPVSEEGPGGEYEDEQEDGPAVDDSEGGFDEPDEEESEQDGSKELADEDLGTAEPTREFVEGELGAAVEVSPMPEYGGDTPPDFPEPDSEEAQDFGMGMGM